MSMLCLFVAPSTILEWERHRFNATKGENLRVMNMVLHQRVKSQLIYRRSEKTAMCWKVKLGLFGKMMHIGFLTSIHILGFWWVDLASWVAISLPYKSGISGKNQPYFFWLVYHNVNSCARCTGWRYICITCERRNMSSRNKISTRVVATFKKGPLVKKE